MPAALLAQEAGIDDHGDESRLLDCGEVFIEDLGPGHLGLELLEPRHRFLRLDRVGLGAGRLGLAHNPLLQGQGRAGLFSAACHERQTEDERRGDGDQPHRRILLRQLGARTDQAGLQVVQAGERLGEGVALRIGQLDGARSGQGTGSSSGVVHAERQLGSVGQCLEQVGG